MVDEALQRWSGREGLRGVRLLEVLEKHAADHKYLSITVDPGGSTGQAVKAFLSVLMDEEPSLGGPHLMFFESAPPFDTLADAQAAADHACELAREYLATFKGTHKLYVGIPEVSRQRVIVWILRDDCDPRDLDLDEETIAADLNSRGGHAWGVVFRGSYSK